MLYLVDGNNRFRRYFETQGATALTKMYVEAVTGKAGFNQTIWVWDGFNAKATRRAIYPEYKDGRNKASDEFYQTVDTFKKLLSYSNAIQIEIPGYEADDVIAHIATDTNCPVFIDSTDLDFNSLLSDRVKYYDPPKTQLLPVDTRLYKTLVGDKSDHIPGLKGFAEKSFNKLTDDAKRFLENDIAHSDSPLAADNPAGLKGKLLENYNASKSELRIFYAVVGFLDVPQRLLSSALKLGSYAPDKAQSIFDELALPMTA